MKQRNTIPFDRPALLLFCLLTLIVPGRQARAGAPHTTIGDNFSTPREVTVKCLECHSKQAEDIFRDVHWQWQRSRIVNGEQRDFGKKTSLAFFGIPVLANQQRCMHCHIDNDPAIAFDGYDPANIDCLVCHDTTGLYRPVSEQPSLNPTTLLTIVRNVGKPTAANCRTCHFAKCSSPLKTSSAATGGLPFTETDVHLRDLRFSCQQCHSPAGRHSFALPADAQTRVDALCASCHSASPHRREDLDNHNKTISCQTCHIPWYATEKPELFLWNWVIAGKRAAMKRVTPSGNQPLLDANGFLAATKMVPVYLWEDRSRTIYMRGDRVDPEKITPLEKPGAKSSHSLLAPFKVIYGTQLYDKKYRYLVSPLLTATGDTLFPARDWNTIALEGMKKVRLPYSGSHEFTATVTYRGINHGVTPASGALKCLDCHGNKGRMDWSLLGYKEDPWSPVKTMTEQTGTSGNPVPPAPSLSAPSAVVPHLPVGQPVQSTGIPGESSTERPGSFAAPQ